MPTPLTHVAISRKEMKWFAEDLQDAVVKALDRDPPRANGEHCRFAPCKIDCPLWTGPMLELADLKLIPRTEMVSREVTPYGDYLAKAKALVDIARALHQGSERAAARLSGRRRQGAGLAAEGQGQAAAVDRRRGSWSRHWQALGFDDRRDLREQAGDVRQGGRHRQAARRQDPDHLRVAPPTNETTVTRADDPAPAVDRATAIEQFRASIVPC